MIRSTKVSLKFANIGKRAELSKFLNEYRRVLRLFIDILWEEKDVRSLLPKEFTEQIDSWLTARMIQCAGKQASGIVRGTRKKHEQRVWRLAELKAAGEDTTRLQELVDIGISKPEISNISAELDERFIKVDLDNRTSFDGWITLGCLGTEKIVIPFKRHKHFNEMRDVGTMSKGLRIREKDATFMFEFEKSIKTKGKILGIDVGISNAVASSAGFLTQADAHGHTLTSILQKISRRKKDSHGFREATAHRKNFINWSINQLNLRGVKEVRCEDIKDLRKGKRTSRFLSHWTYGDVFDKLERFCEEQGVLVTKVNPAYSSQTCSQCGRLGKRRGKSFVCPCGYKGDADLNAASNLAGEPIVPRKNIFP